MDPQQQFCHNEHCWAYARKQEGHIVIHSQREKRYRCKRCKRTFSATKGTAFYRTHKSRELILTILTLLAHGCPLQAIVAAFSLDERTVRRWQMEAGAQCKRVHEHLVEAAGVDLGQVQADELRVKAVGGILWLAMAMEVGSRLWLGGVVSERRDRYLIRALLGRVRACGSILAGVLLCTDGLASYPKEALRLFREALRTGRRGRPRLILPEKVMVAQVIKRYAKRRVKEVVRRVVRGTQESIGARVEQTQRRAESVINTAYIERLNATFRACLAPLARRTRAGVHRRATLESGMWLVGCCYNLCWTHRSLRRRRRREVGGSPGGRWVESTPAQAAGLSEHRWTLEELMSFVVQPAEVPKRRGRRPKWLVEAAHAA